MSDSKSKNKASQTPKRKLNIYRLITVGLGIAIVVISAVIIITVLAKKNAQGAEEGFIAGEMTLDSLQSESDSTSEFLPENDSQAASFETIEEENQGEETVEEESTEESVEEEYSEEEPSEDISEEEIPVDSTVDLSDPAAIVTNWETIPAGTVIAASSIDFNNLSQYFVAYEISDTVYEFINGKSYQENPNVGLDDLRYLKLLHYNFNHELQVGELIVAADLQSDFIGIFTELFAAEYEIQSMYLPDNYWTGDPTTTDSASIDVNNTSCFMYRPATGSGNLSKHAYGRAIDINPQQNPYVSYTSGSPVWSHENANDYIDRTTGLPHVITEDDICYQIFTKYGFNWGGAWTNIKDYQHFQK